MKHIDISREMTEAEKEEFNKDFTTEPDVKAKVLALLEELHTVCDEHNIPFISSTIFTKQTQEDGTSWERHVCGVVQGTRCPDFFHEAAILLRTGHQEDQSTRSIDKLLQAIANM